ncbi:hypothetical protein JCM6882_002913 [Rhodosporidiobolus microsporus]
MTALGAVPSKGMAIFVGLFASFGGFLFGYDTGYIAGVKGMDYFKFHYGDLQPDGTYEISTATDSLITSILSAGTFVGALAAGPILGFFGRRVGLGIYLLLFAAGVAMQTAAYDVPLFPVGRAFAGLGVGGVSVGVPICQCEVCRPSSRAAPSSPATNSPSRWVFPSPPCPPAPFPSPIPLRLSETT